MKPIQLVLLLAPTLAIFFIKSRKLYLTRVFTRLGFMAISLGFIFIIFSPNSVIQIANLLGVGRGTDLIVYLMAMCFFLLCVIIFIKVKEIENKIVKIVREISLLNVENDRK